MKALPKLFENNKVWAAKTLRNDPNFFTSLVKQQSPEYLWIGCSDSRVPANEIVGLLPGELFVHRNVANLVIHTDMNCLSVLQYAVDLLKIRHVIVCGHYGCGGIKAALDNHPHGLVDNWLRHVRDIQHRHRRKLNALPSENDRLDRMCELNVVEQVINVGNTTIIQEHWERRQEIAIHGWVYGIADGRLKDLNVCIRSSLELDALQRKMRIL